MRRGYPRFIVQPLGNVVDVGRRIGKLFSLAFREKIHTSQFIGRSTQFVQPFSYTRNYHGSSSCSENAERDPFVSRQLDHLSSGASRWDLD